MEYWNPDAQQVDEIEKEFSVALAIAEVSTVNAAFNDDIRLIKLYDFVLLMHFNGT